jgi:predicted nucleic acid-binding protein
MIPYLDASALVKRYVQEPGSEEVSQLIARARVVGTSAITRVEVTAALARAARVRALPAAEARAALTAFQGEWESLVRVELTEVLLGRAAQAAWERGLRGYDAVHLASALFWQEMLGESVTLVTYDRELWEAAGHAGLGVFPPEKP